VHRTPLETVPASVFRRSGHFAAALGQEKTDLGASQSVQLYTERQGYTWKISIEVEAAHGLTPSKQGGEQDYALQFACHGVNGQCHAN
jgi:hypothetical protein